MELVLTVADGFNAVTFHLAVGFVAATTTRGGNCDHTAVASKSVAMAARRNRLLHRLLIEISLRFPALTPHRYLQSSRQYYLHRERVRHGSRALLMFQVVPESEVRLFGSLTSPDESMTSGDDGEDGSEITRCIHVGSLT